MRALLRLTGCALILTVMGCKAVDVTRYDIQERGENGLTIVTYTKENLSSLDKTFWVDHVYLRCAVVPVNITKRFDIGFVEPEEYPFVAQRLDIQVQCRVVTTDYCSTWFIHFHEKQNIRGLEYFSGLDVNAPSTLKLRLGGGGMVGARLVSTERVIEVNAP
ncbi:hypothetical protein BWP39_21205 [Paraburkholderia acidicola]|uniref:Lipoprotein n=1 Tax=Paraburkholderia acidicola TaxID=1912599 RepID=A0A2A4EN00_9BURK|nr:hypothetical protein [Paraburkholderia acidicola]PCE22195.1 hypothetical protein BWP39_21205 [Paraburkholderia acidicola]